MNEMPNLTVYKVLLVVGFLCGIIWGALSMGPYNKMKAAVEAGDVAEARSCANKIRIFVIIGVILNVFFIIGRLNG